MPNPRVEIDLKARLSCSCCEHYDPGAPCPFYVSCKGSLDGEASWWVYSQEIEQASRERGVALTKLREK